MALTATQLVNQPTKPATMGILRYLSISTVSKILTFVINPLSHLVFNKIG